MGSRRDGRRRMVGGRFWKWLQDRIGDGRRGDGVDRMEDGTTIEEKDLEGAGLKIGRRGGAELAT